jgi:antitoxin ParD1/3/4
MRLWQKKEEEHQARLALIRDRLTNSARSGDPVPLDDAFKTIERSHKQRMKSDEKI